jgi:hypothetical protein
MLFTAGIRRPPKASEVRVTCLLEWLDRLNPLIQAATLVAVIVYVWKTSQMARATRDAANASKSSLREMELSREQEVRPYVICYFESVRGTSFFEFVIRNTGRSIAFNVSLKFTPELKYYGSAQMPPLAFKEFTAAPPGFEWRTFMGSFIDLDLNAVPDTFSANVAYSYAWGQGQKADQYVLPFDLKSLRGKYYLSRTPIEVSLAGC